MSPCVWENILWHRLSRRVFFTKGLPFLPVPLNPSILYLFGNSLLFSTSFSTSYTYIRTFLSIRILQAGKISSSCIWTTPLASCQNPADQCNYAHILSHDHLNMIKNMIMITLKNRRPPSFPPQCSIYPRSSFYTCRPLGSFEHFEIGSKSRLDLAQKTFWNIVQIKCCPILLTCHHKARLRRLHSKDSKTQLASQTENKIVALAIKKELSIAASFPFLSVLMKFDFWWL